jgi:hypothetical protein
MGNMSERGPVHLRGSAVSTGCRSRRVLCASAEDACMGKSLDLTPMPSATQVNGAVNGEFKADAMDVDTQVQGHPEEISSRPPTRSIPRVSICSSTNGSPFTAALAPPASFTTPFGGGYAGARASGGNVSEGCRKRGGRRECGGEWGSVGHKELLLCYPRKIWKSPISPRSVLLTKA